MLDTIKAIAQLLNAIPWWPVTILILAWMFRKVLDQKLKEVTEVSGAGAKVNFDKAAESFTKLASELPKVIDIAHGAAEDQPKLQPKLQKSLDKISDAAQQTATIFETVIVNPQQVSHTDVSPAIKDALQGTLRDLNGTIKGYSRKFSEGKTERIKK